MRPDSPVYLLMQRREDSSVSLLSETANDGARTVFVFDESVRAEAFLIVENTVEDLGPGWEVIGFAFLAAAELLEVCADEGIRYVVLNPPSALARGDEVPQPIPIERFIGYLLGE